MERVTVAHSQIKNYTTSAESPSLLSPRRGSARRVLPSRLIRMFHAFNIEFVKTPD